MAKYTLGGDPPQSRSEEILMGKKPTPQSRLEELLMNKGSGSVTPEQIEAAVEAYLEENPITVEPFVIPVTKSGGIYSTTATAADILANIDNCVIIKDGAVVQQAMYQVLDSNAIILFSPSTSLNGYIANESFIVYVDGSDVSIDHFSADARPTPRVVMASTDTAPTLDPNKLYVFPEMASLTPTLATPTDNTIVNEYHFIFESGATATTTTFPAIPGLDDFAAEANMVYEVSILEGLALVTSWAVTA